MSMQSVSGGCYQPLTAQQVQTVHEAGLTLLEDVGVGYEPGLNQAVDLLVQAGASLDSENRKVYLPRELVEQSVAKAPSRVVLYSRNGDYDLDLSQHVVHLGTGGAAIRILDLETGAARSTTLSDLYHLGRLVDELKNISFFLRPCIPTDIPDTAYDINVFYTCFKSTAKHVMAGVNNEQELHKVLDLAAHLAGSVQAVQEKPFFSIITSFIISPMKLSTLPVKIMLECVKNGVPVALSGAPMAGSTSPLTMAGTLAQCHAEQMAGITLCQLTHPGAPVLYGGIPSRADLKTMNYCGGAVECGMMNAAIHQLAHHIQVPNYNSSGLSDSKVPDAQAGWEKGMTTLLAAMGGSNYVHHAAGMLESMLGLAYEQFILDDEIIGMTRRVLQGIDVDAEHLAHEVIKKAGPGGEFITADHTFEHMFDEYYMGNGVTDRSNRASWERAGELDAWMRARKMVQTILSNQEKSYIPEDIDAKIREKYSILL
ncbi:MAG: trimethylamine methyltransferase family protein [Desulfovermiculus sp.]